MRAWLVVMLGAAVAAGCSGPPAPDGVICQDLIHRLCQPEPCFVAIAALHLGDNCEADLLARTGCSAEDYAFPETLGRERVLQCRQPLLRKGLEWNQHPDCQDVQELIDFCPDVVAWLTEAGP